MRRNLPVLPWFLGVRLASFVLAGTYRGMVRYTSTDDAKRLFLTVLGAPLAVLVLLAYLTHLMLASLGAGVFLGSVALKYIAKRDVHPVTWQSLTLGIVVLALFSLVPFLGWLVVSVFFLIALGGLVRHTFKVLALGR